MIAAVAASVVVSAAVAWVVTHAVLAARTRDTADDRRHPTVCCTACGATFGTRQEARDHARDAHNAPGDPAAVDEVLELVERGD